MSLKCLYNVTGNCLAQEDCPNDRQHCKDSVCVGEIFIHEKYLKINMYKYS